MAILEQGEAVLTQKQKNGLLSIFDGLASKIQTITSLASAIPASISEKISAGSMVQVDASISIDGAVSLDDSMMSFLNKYPDVVAEKVSKVLNKQ